MNLFPAAEETLCGTARRIRRGETTAAEVLAGCLDRIDELEADLQAWVVVDRERARDQAQRLDADFRQGKVPGPLHGIPLGIKDIVDVAGLPTTAGSAARANTIAERDATLVHRLRNAGAVIVGKTVTTQFACFDPPPTRNPWNRQRTPGGSSSGSAVAVATGMCLGAIGSQTGGSITRPAAFCGIVGMKPSFGRVSVDGVVPVAGSLDHPGPMTRSVADLALLYDVIAGHDERDPHSVREPVEPLTPLVEQASGAAPRLGRAGDIFDEYCEQEMRDLLGGTLAKLETQGAVVDHRSFPASFAGVLDHHRRVMIFEMTAWHRERLTAMPDDYAPLLRGLIEEGMTITTADYIESRNHQAVCSREIESALEGVDALITPASTGPAPDFSTTGSPVMNAPWSYTGLPTISLPIGLSRDGLPVAIQLVGRRYGERELMKAALWCEAVIRG